MFPLQTRRKRSRLAAREAGVALWVSAVAGRLDNAVEAMSSDERGNHECSCVLRSRPAIIDASIARNPWPPLMNLPGTSGRDALRVLRGWPETEQIPVIALTAAATEKERERGKQLGFHRYLTKPVDIAAFERTLEALLRKRSI